MKVECQVDKNFLLEVDKTSHSKTTTLPDAFTMFLFSMANRIFVLMMVMALVFASATALTCVLKDGVSIQHRH